MGGEAAVAADRAARAAAKRTVERADRLMVLLRQREKMVEMVRKQEQLLEELQARRGRIEPELQPEPRPSFISCSRSSPSPLAPILILIPNRHLDGNRQDEVEDEEAEEAARLEAEAE
eukprot:5485945-Prymnesium_polylepis.1